MIQFRGKHVDTSIIKEYIIVSIGFSIKFIFPLLIYPFLARWLSVEEFGHYAAAYSLSLLTFVFVEYAFNLTGTRAASVASNKDDLSQIFSSVLIAKLILCAIGISTSVAFWFANSASDVYVVGAIFGCIQGMSPFWYFQARRKAFVGILFDIAGLSVSLTLILIFARNQGGATIAMAAHLFGATLSASLAHAVLIGELAPLKWNLRLSISFLKEGLPAFVSRSAIVIYSSASVFLVSLLAGAEQAAIYGVAEKIATAASALLRPIATVALPLVATRAASHKSKKDAVSYSLQTAIVTSIIFSIISLVVTLNSDAIIYYIFGKEFQEASSTLSIIIWTLPIIAINTIFGTQMLVSFSKDQIMMAVVLIGCALSAAATFIWVGANGANGMAAVRVATEITLCLAYAGIGWAMWNAYLDGK